MTMAREAGTQANKAVCAEGPGKGHLGPEGSSLLSTLGAGHVLSYFHMSSPSSPLL